MTPEEKATWGWLGEPPRDVLEGSLYIVRQWKKLVSDARSVARMSIGNQKVRAAKDIERRRMHLIAIAKQEREARAEKAAT